MFENPFSFQGRIRRLYYGLSILIIYAVLVLAIIAARFGIRSSLGTVVPMILIPMYWFLFAQGAKRCHDLGKSGWWQLIPFFVLGCFLQMARVVPMNTVKIQKLYKRRNAGNP